MKQVQWNVDIRRFRSQEEYQAALRDKELIDSITDSLSLDRPQDVEKLYLELKKGKVRFETQIGRQFDDYIYELYQNIQIQRHEKLEAEILQRHNKQLKKQQEMEKIGKVFQKKEKVEKEKINIKDFDKKMQKEIALELKKRRLRRKILIMCCAFVGIISFGYYGYYYNMAEKSTEEFEELASLKDQKVPKGIMKQFKVHLLSDDSERPEVLPEYEALFAKNQKLIGWIKIDDTVIDYPVMQTENNEYYLNHGFNQNEDKNGSIFMDYKCDVIKGCDNYILYGHHMQSGKMFGGLSNYSNQKYYEEHPTIHFDTIYEKGEYQIMYVFRSKLYSEEEITFKYYQFINAASIKEFYSAMKEMAALSLYDTGVSASYGDQILTLSTCDYQESNGRFVVVAKKK